MTSLTEQYNTWGFSTVNPVQADVGGTGFSNNVNATLQFTGNVVLSPNLSGVGSFTVAAVSGVTSPTIVGLQTVEALGTTVGNIVRGTLTVSMTATATTAIINIGVPTSTTALFANTTQANGTAVVTSGTSLGNLTSIASVAASRNVQVTLNLGSGSGTYTANIDFVYKIN